MAQPEKGDEDEAPEANDYPMPEAASVASKLGEYGTGVAMFAVFAWFRDVPLEAVAGAGTFVAVVLLANRLFNRLAGIHRLRYRLSLLTTNVQSGGLGTILAGVADLAHEYVAHLGLAGSALAGFVVALVFSGWRQRWSERRIYRELLSPS